jgi:hydrogenase maturation protein HypF
MPALTQTLWRIQVRGLVQGVGFRPFVWKLARELGLNGTVRNTPEGVIIDILADFDSRDRFLLKLREGQPKLARIDHISAVPAEIQNRPTAFTILESLAGKAATAVTPDAAICQDCAREVLDPSNRRFGYAFANCTQCGPRLTIVRKIPYDRANMTMAKFPMCVECQAEYGNPADRRFHAEPIACAQCGPKLWLENSDGQIATPSGAEIEAVALLLKAGKIVALKGLGGFHIACLAGNETAVSELRRRKRRGAKPFALMGLSLGQIGDHARISDAEAETLSSPVGPIVLLRSYAASNVASSVAPGQERIGFMLPTTPLHLLLLNAVGEALVMTSANESGQPQFIDNESARSELFGIADAILFHDRDIENRVDDSVVRIDAPGPSILRRARGYAPAPLILPGCLSAKSPVFAAGADIKSAFCLAGSGEAVLSQHMGDLDEPDTCREYERTVGLYLDLLESRPAIVACDMHPSYRSSDFARRLATKLDAELIPVQHHHAHLAACLAENSSDNSRTLGIILDGAGYGPDGTIWGGEFLIGNYLGFEREAHFLPVPLLGGDKASTEPWRNAYAHLRLALGNGFIDGEFRDLPVMGKLSEKPVALLEAMMLNPRLAPLSSSAGRLFDAFSYVIGAASEQISYEGQTGMELEALAGPLMDQAEAYPVLLPDPGLPVRWDALWVSALEEVRKDMPAGLMAARFHKALVDILTKMAVPICERSRLDRVALSGGVFQNRLLLEGVHSALTSTGIEVLVHNKTPASDGGIALGQAAIALARLTERQT